LRLYTDLAKNKFLPDWTNTSLDLAAVMFFVASILLIFRILRSARATVEDAVAQINKAKKVYMSIKIIAASTLGCTVWLWLRPFVTPASVSVAALAVLVFLAIFSLPLLDCFPNRKCIHPRAQPEHRAKNPEVRSQKSESKLNDEEEMGDG
jgi:hypothetical protein